MHTACILTETVVYCLYSGGEWFGPDVRIMDYYFIRCSFACQSFFSPFSYFFRFQQTGNGFFVFSAHWHKNCSGRSLPERESWYFALCRDASAPFPHISGKRNSMPQLPSSVYLADRRNHFLKRRSMKFYSAASSIFSIKIPYPLVGSFTRTCVNWGYLQTTKFSGAVDIGQ